MGRPRHQPQVVQRRQRSVPARGGGPITTALQRARLAAFLGDPQPEAAAKVSADLAALLEEAAHVYAAAVSEGTRADYVRRWRRFQQWCTERGEAALPADPGIVMLFLAEHGTGQDAVSLATLRGWLSAINRVHLEAGERPPSEDPGMRMFLRGLSRTAPARHESDPVKALRISDLREICRHLARGADDPVSLRDQAMLALHGNGVTAAELAHLRWPDVHLNGSKVRLRLRPSLTAQLTTRTIGSPAVAGEVSAAKALSQWRATAGDGHECCFFRVDASLRVHQVPLRASDIDRILRHRLESLTADDPVPPARAAGLLQGGPSADLRDRAMLLIGFAGAFRRIEVTRLRWSDIRDTPNGIVVLVRRSKTDPLAHGAEVGIPYGRSDLTCPVRALHAWRERVVAQHGPTFDPDGPCFVRVGRAGRIGHEHLTGEALSRMLRRRAQQAGLSGRWGGRSLRTGFISTAADLDIPLELIARQSRHATLDSLILYIRQDDPFRRNASTRLGM